MSRWELLGQVTEACLHGGELLRCAVNSLEHAGPGGLPLHGRPSGEAHRSNDDPAEPGHHSADGLNLAGVPLDRLHRFACARVGLVPRGLDLVRSVHSGPACKGHVRFVAVHLRGQDHGYVANFTHGSASSG